MNIVSSRRFVVFLAVVLCTVLVATLSFSLTPGISFADPETAPTLDGSLMVGHISDVHYFPLEYSYLGVHNDGYEDSDFFYSMTGDTKLVLESGLVQNKLIHSIIEDAEAGIAPHYLIASGDLSKNGERVALIDVANSFRYLQNRMRAIPGYEDFQVFATTGNHDLYNPDGAVYSQEDGSNHDTDVVSAMQFALIFAGLGYPNANLTGADGAIKLTDYMPAEYWSSTFTSGYQTSSNSTLVEINYYSPVLQEIKNTADASERLEKYYELKDSVNVLSFTAEVTKAETKGYSFLVFDSSDRTYEKVGTIVAVGRDEYDTIPQKDDQGNDNIFFLEDANGEIDTAHKLTKSSDNAAIIAAFDAGNRVYRGTHHKHLTGGRITTDCLDWAEEYCNTQTGAKTTLGEETIFATVHQNILPHWDQEDDILKDFTIYNWEYTAKRLLAMGCRYVFTGHMHASDLITYTDAEGRTLYDFETGSCVSYGSPCRYLTVERENCDGQLGEKSISKLKTINMLKELASDDIYNDSPAAQWNQTAYNTAIAAYKANPTAANWQAVLDSNPRYAVYITQYDFLSVLPFNTYATIDIYSRLVQRVVDHFVSEKLIASLKDMVAGLLVGEDSILPSMFESFASVIVKLADYIIDTIVYDLYGDAGYPLDSENAIEYLKKIVAGILDKEYGDASLASAVNPGNAGKVKFKDIAAFIAVAHAQGTEVKLCTTDAELQAEYAYIDAHFFDLDCSIVNAIQVSDPDKAARTRMSGYMHPTDKTYRKRMTAAIKDLHEQAVSGEFVVFLLNSVLDPLYRNNNSLLKTLLNYEFDFSKGMTTRKHDDPSQYYFTEEEYSSINKLFTKTLSGTLFPALLKSLLGFDTGKKQFETFVPTHFVLNDTINELMPGIKTLLASLIGFNLTGDTLTEAVDTALDGYLTESFYVGIGGILDNILVAFATDEIPDVADMNDLAVPFLLQPYEGFSYGGVELSYAAPKLAELKSFVGAEFNPATQDNGRVPSHVTASYDIDAPTTGYVIKFYTAEDVYASFGFREAGEEVIYHSVSTSRATANMSLPYIDSTATQTFGGVTVKITTQTKPQYIPLIDLGLAALTHGQIEDDDDNPYTYADRDAASANSVIYWNVTTVYISGLDPNKEYEYDLEGIYLTSAGEELRFSLATYSSAPSGPVRSFRMKTAKPDTATEFEFLAIADIQGMIQGMYSNSYKAVEALLKDDRTKNFDFVLNAGDMVDSGKNFYQWGYALNTYQPLFANYAQIFTAGNHEGNTYGMTNFFDYAIPEDTNGDPLITDVLGGVYYSFDYANAHFVVLNTNDASTKGLGEVQYNWLKHDLETSTKKWKFVLMHKSLFSGGSHSYDGEVVAMREQLVPLFAETGVNIVFAGHDHTYTSTMLIDKDGNATDKSDINWVQYTGDGVLYLTLGTMGTKFYEYGENPAVTPNLDASKSILRTLDTQTFGKVIISGDKIEYTSYYYDRNTNSIVEVGESKLSSEPVAYYDHNKKPLSVGAIAGIAVACAAVVIGVIVAVVVALAMKKLAGKHAVNANEPVESDFEDNPPADEE